MEGLVDLLDAQDVAPGRLLELEADEGANEARALGAARLHLVLQLLDLLHARLRLARLRGVGAEALHEALELADLLLGGGVLGVVALLVLVLLVDEVGVAARVLGDGLVIDIGDRRRDRVEEVAIVRDEHERAFELVHQERLEPADGIEIEMVGGLVEEQHVGLAEEHLGDENAQLVAGGQAAHLVAVLVGGDAETLEQLGGLALGHVAVLLGDGALELAQADTDLVGDLADQEGFLFVQGLPQALVAHHDGVEDALVVVLEVVLLEDAEAHAAGDGDPPRVGLLEAREHLDERRFPRAVGPGEAVALAGIELHRDVLEEDLGTEAFGEVFEQDHGEARLARSGRFRAALGTRGQPGQNAGRVHPSSLAPGMLLAGRYRIERELGRGAMGAVYVVTHVNTGATLALKVMLDSLFLEEDRAERFRREARAASLVRSDHVVRITDADTAPELGGAPFLVMDLLEGENLDQRIERDGPLSPAETIAVMRDIGRALDRAHDAGVVHRDLKPENIFLQRRDDGTTTVKLLDFGISKIMQDDSLASSSGGAILGTPLYMAPEQVRSGTQVGPATDVWSVGMLAVEMLTGESYWKAPTAFDLMMAIVAPERPGPSKRFPNLGLAFDAWFQRSCAASPDDRWPRAGEQASALAQALVADGARPLVRDPQAAPAAATARTSIDGMAATLGTLTQPSAPALLAASASSIPGPLSASARAARPRRALAAAVAALVPAVLVLSIVRVWPHPPTTTAPPVSSERTEVASTATEPASLPTSALAAPPHESADSSVTASLPVAALASASSSGPSSAKPPHAGGPGKHLAPPSSATPARPPSRDLFDTPN